MIKRLSYSLDGCLNSVVYYSNFFFALKVRAARDKQCILMHVL